MDQMPEHPLKLAVSGTYSSGKTTTTEALSIATGLPRTDALTAREIVVDLIPGKRFEQLSGRELLTLGLRRLEERIHTEAAQPGSFISDGSVLHEWVYGEARMRVGINPGAPPLHRAVKRVVGIPAKPFYQQYMNAYGTVVKARAKRLYDAFVHLPVEFTMKADGHRPVSEEYRHVSDRLLTETLDELEIPYWVVGGTVAQRVEKILYLFRLKPEVPVDEAIEIAADRIRRSKEMVAERQIANTVNPSLWRRIAYAVRY
jgi:nicotinamide riboside kinase